MKGIQRDLAFREMKKRLLLLKEKIEKQRLLESPAETQPVSIREFIDSPEYLDMADSVWPGVKDDLEAMCAPGILSAIIEQGIGGGKSYRVSIKLLYDLYCLAFEEIILGRNPRDRFDLDPDAMISVANVSLRHDQAKKVVFGYISTFIDRSPWFQRHMPRDKTINSELRFVGRNYSIFPGHGHQSSVIGLNLYSCVIDEANFFVKTEGSNTSGLDYAAEMYDAIESRIRSRFGLGGFLGVISSRRTVEDFTARKIRAVKEDRHSSKQYYTPDSRPAWEDWPESKKQKSQWREFDKDKYRFKSQPVTYDECRDLPGLWVPDTLWGPFSSNPESSMRDHASVPSDAVSPYMRRKDKICPDWDKVSPILPGVLPQDWMLEHIRFDDLVADWFVGHPDDYYHFHVDLAKGTRDAAGIAVTRCSGIDEVVSSEGQRKAEKAALVDCDLMIQIKAPPGGEIDFARIRKLLYWLKDERGFKFRMSSFDGWQSVDSQQILSRKGFLIEEFSLDRNLEGYDTLKDAMYEDRFFFPPAHGQTPETTYEELRDMAEAGDPCAVFQIEMRALELINDKKVDHPNRGSKDVSDAVAGAVTQASRNMRGASASPSSYQNKASHLASHLQPGRGTY